MRPAPPRTVGVILLLTALTLPVRAQQPEGDRIPLDGIAAIVGSEIILKSEVNLQLYLDLQSRRIDPETLSEAEADSLRRNILDALINQKVIVARARRDSIVVSRSEVDAAVEQWIVQLRENIGGEEAFRNALAAEGMTERELRERRWEMAENELLRGRLFQQLGIRQSPVSRREAEAFLSNWADDLMPLRDIFLETPPPEAIDALARERAEELRRRIVEGGVDFAALARSESADAGSGAAGGDLGSAPPGTYVASIDSTVWNTPVGEVSRPVRSQFGWHLVQVMARDENNARARHILVGLQTDQALAGQIDSLESALTAGEDFGALVPRFSQAPGAGANEGFFAVIPYDATPQTSNLPQEWIRQIQRLEPGSWVGPLDAPEGVYYFQRLPMNEATIELILRADFARIEFYIGQQRQIAQIEEYLQQLRSETYIEIKP